jgi:hypothetical protein
MALTPTIPTIIMFISMASLLLIVGLNLLYKSINTKIKNLAFLTAFHLGAAFAAFFQMFNSYSDEVIYNLIVKILYFSCVIFLSLFIRLTFYKDKRSPFTLILLISTVVFIISLIVGVINPTSIKDIYYFLGQFTLNILIMIAAYWYGFVALKQYNTFKNQDIQPWIKKRYLISSMTSFCFASSGLSSTIIEIINWELSIRIISIISLLITTILLITFVIGSFLAWVMPERLKRFFNKGYQISNEKELSEEEIMEQLKEG